MQKPLVIPEWSGTYLKALILGSPVPMNTFTEDTKMEWYYLKSSHFGITSAHEYIHRGTPKWTHDWPRAYISAHSGAYW